MNKFENMLVRPLARRVLAISQDKVMTPYKAFLRTACVGSAIIPKLFRIGRLDVTHAQKAHIEFLAQLNHSAHKMVDDVDIQSFLTNNSKAWRQELLKINFENCFLNADFSLLDSFCELTDLKLKLPSGSVAYGHRKDFNFESGKKFELHEISFEKIQDAFDAVLNSKNSVSPHAPVVYLHYSSINDTRKKYISLSKSLLENAWELENKYSFFRVLALDSDQYLPAETDNHPYHYSKKTLVALAEKLSIILNDFGIKSSRYVTLT